MSEKPTCEELKKRVKVLEKESEKLKHTEKALRECEEKYRTLSSNIPGMVYRGTSGWSTEIISNSEMVCGYSISEFSNQMVKWLDLIHPDDKQRVFEEGSKLIEKPKSIVQEYRILAKDGSMRWVSDYKTSFFKENGSFIGVDGCVYNITERKQGEEALRESEERFRYLSESSPIGVFETDKSGSVQYLNNKWLAITGMSMQNALGFGWGDALHPEDRPRILAEWAKCLEDKIGWDGEFRFVRPSGEVRWVRTRTSPVISPAGDMISQVGVNEDITERKQTEEALRESEERYRTILSSIEDSYFEVNQRGDITYFNEAFSEITGYPPDELMGMKNDKYLDQENRKKVFKKFNEVWKTAIPTKLFEYELIRKNGKKRTVQTSASLVTDRNGQKIGFRGIIRDVSDRKRMEKALRESEEKLARSNKMEALGLLAGGVAHDLNNVLSGIVSYPELILLDLSEDNKLRKPIETMQESGHRAAAIVQDLLTVARGVATTKKPLHLNNLVGDYLQSPEFKKLEQFHPTVTVKTNLDTELLNISGSHVHIRKVVMNLVSNASEAIEDSGNVIISTMNRYVDRPLMGYDDINIGEYSVLSVSDDGFGISSIDLERIFEPFYTKKVMGRSGTGLGLAVVWNVMQDHKGYINVTSDESGSTFELYFPITREEISDKDLSIPIEDFKGDGETILVVDDVKSQRDISCKMLDVLGYNTRSVSSGEEAVEYLKENTVDLLLLDMIMDPGINGRETYERIIKIHPNQKAIIISGFAETDEVKEAQKLGAGQYIKKPVTLEKIGLAVKEELDK